MGRIDDDARTLQLTLERLCSLFRSQLREEAVAHGLQLVQLEALIYFSVANRYSDTAGALADYLGVTKGTASQSVMALERRGLVEKVPDTADGRVQHCTLTQEGRRIADAAHPAPIASALAPAAQRDAAAAAVALLRSLQSGRDFRTFGQCQSCVHFQRKAGRARCGLTGEPLTQADSLKLCREHTPNVAASQEIKPR